MRVFNPMLCLCGLLACLTSSARAAQLSCQVTYAGATQTVTAQPVVDPYPAAATDIRGRFRFKPLLVGTSERVDRVLIYVYLNTSTQPILVQQAKYLPPFASALTGEQRVYAGPMERELIYQCDLQGGTP